MKKKFLNLIIAFLFLCANNIFAQIPGLVKDVQATNWVSDNRILINNQWFFQTDGTKLWKTDGTTAGTIMLKQFGSTNLYVFHELNGKLLLFADDNNNGTFELWTSDGTVAGTVLVKDLQATNWVSTNRAFINNQWFFQTDGTKLWKTDGTTAGTIMLKQFGSTNLYTFHELNNKLLLFADDNNNGTFELWTSDGTVPGTVLVKDLLATNWVSTNRALINNQWFFQTDGTKLWKTDGTTAGTIMLKQFGSTNLYTFHELNNKLLLFADDNNNGTFELWTSDGTVPGTVLVKDLQATNWVSTNRALINNQWFFQTDGTKLWKTDGTTAGTIMLKQFGSSNLYTFHELNNKLLLFADDNNNGTFELWTSDGTVPGTVLVKDLLATNWVSTNRALINNQWFFQTDGTKLWKTDGTTAGTIMLKQFGSTNLYTFHELNGKLLLFADDNNNGTFELWTSNGTVPGTLLVKDMLATNWVSANRILINNQCFFQTDGTKLWKTDGTTAGTIMLKQFGSTNLYTFHELNNKLLLFADDNNNGTFELWGADVAVEIMEIHYSNDKTVSIYPNPFSHSTTVEISASQWTKGDLVICDVSGQVVHRGSLNSKTETLNLNLPGGIYFYKITSDTKEIIGNGKLLIQ